VLEETTNDAGGRWRKADEIFVEALELHPSRVARFVAEVCGEDVALREAVEGLLEAHRSASSFLERPAEDVCDVPWDEILESTRPEEATDPYPDRTGERVGPYRLVDRLGRGGMATVYSAERVDGQWDERVAVKVVRRGIDTEDTIRRFLAERQILSSLNHPNIARFLGGGTTDDGLPYLVLERVEGTPITRYCDEHRSGLEERLDLFADVCRAVQFAHANLVVHRDLKPSNIMVTARGRVKLLDFGIAKILDAAADDPRTRTLLRPLTPEYASPEQVSGEPITTASDVYQLGLLLCEVVAGRRPYEVRALSPARMEEAILTARPRRPSELVTEEGARDRRTKARSLSRRLAGDLDLIVLKAIRKEPERRYATAEALLQDLERYREGLPISARSDSVAYRARRLLGRKPWLAPTAALVILAAGGYVYTLAHHARALERERNVARAQATRAEEVQSLLAGLFRSADPFTPHDSAYGANLTVIQALDVGARRLRTELADRPVVRGELLLAISQALSDLGQYDQSTRTAEEALRSLGTAPGEAPDLLGRVLLQLGALAAWRGMPDSADALYHAAVAKARSAHPRDDPALAPFHASLGRFQYDVGRLDSSRLHLERAVALERAADPVPEGDLAGTLANLSDTYRGLDEMDAARTAIQEARRLDEKVFGPDAVQTGFALVSEAGELEQEQRLDESEADFRRAIDILERRLGAEDPNTTAAMNNLALLLASRGELAGAESLQRRVLDIRRRTLGEDHRETASGMQNLAAVLSREGKYDEAEQLLGRASEIYRRTLLPGNQLVAFPLLTQADIRLRRSDYPGAESSAREAARILREALPDGHWITAVAECRLGRALAGQGRLEEARPLLEGAAEDLADREGTPQEKYLGACRAALARLDSLPAAEADRGS